MTRMHFAVALLAGALISTTMAAPAQAQSLAAIAAAPAATSATAVEKAGAGCWGCVWLPGGAQACKGGFVPGYYNCGSRLFEECWLSSPGCGAGASLPVDPDGSTQYVSRGARLGILAVSEDTPDLKRNCDGAVVALRQSFADIERVRTRTGTLSL